MIVLSYDVDTTDAAGAKRLRKVAKICEAKGCRVQNSVFELLVDPAQLTTLKAQLEKVIDPEKDSVRFYRLGSIPCPQSPQNSPDSALPHWYSRSCHRGFFHL